MRQANHHPVFHSFRLKDGGVRGLAEHEHAGLGILLVIRVEVLLPVVLGRLAGDYVQMAFTDAWGGVVLLVGHYDRPKRMHSFHFHFLWFVGLLRRL
ncbi:hypothetical protein D3C71_1172080 [compost metagenome]